MIPVCSKGVKIVLTGQQIVRLVALIEDGRSQMYPVGILGASKSTPRRCIRRDTNTGILLVDLVQVRRGRQI